MNLNIVRNNEINLEELVKELIKEYSHPNYRGHGGYVERKKKKNLEK